MRRFRRMELAKAALKARPDLAHSIGCVMNLIYHCQRKVNYLTQNDGFRDGIYPY
jgi:hypothetical protein